MIREFPRRMSLISSRPMIGLMLVFLVFALLAGCKPAGESEPASAESARAVSADGARILVHNATFYTFDPGNTVVTGGAMAVGANGRIIAMGDIEPMMSLYGDLELVDMEGRAVFPGLIDSHGHLYGLAISYTQANLVGTESKEDVIRRLQEFASELPDGEWLLGRGWDQNDWPDQVFPTRDDLDAAFPDRPVWLRRIDGHASWGNSAAIAASDRDLDGDWQVEGGHIYRDESGRATGIFIDRAIALVEDGVPEPSAEVVSAALDVAMQNSVSLGLTGIHDPGIKRDILTLYRQKIHRGKFPLRVYAMADGANETMEWLCEEGPMLFHTSGRLKMRSVKLYNDGALGSRGAAMLKDYADDPGNQGLLFNSDEALEEQVRRVMSCGLQAGIHAIGDAANRQVLDTIERLAPEFPDNPGRHRIEHAQILAVSDIPRFAELDVIAAMQPIHATSDMYWAVDRIGPEREPGAYAWKSLKNSGAVLAFGSDFPVEQVNPMLGIYASLTRQDLDGWPEGGWMPEERLDRVETLRAFTIDAAYSGFWEDEVGSLEVGKQADFIVLDRDIMQVPVTEIPEARVLQTWLAGERVFERL